MAIFKPGQKFRNHKLLRRKGAKRSLVVVLSLTAMVDMFTVLAIFLLQNYSVTGEILYLPKEVVLPKANRIVDLKPAMVITVSTQHIYIDKEKIVSYAEINQSKDWLIPSFRDQAKLYLEKARQKQENQFQAKFKKVVEKTIGDEKKDPLAWSRVTIQADKDVEFVNLKKIMYSLYQAGAGPINFAVTKELNNENSNSKTQN